MQTPKRKPGKYTNQQKDPNITQAKYNELKNKLEKLQASLPAVKKEVSRLAEMGDFSENAAYQMAKGRLRGMNEKIQELTEYFKTVEIIKPSGDNARIRLGHKVTVESDGKQQEFIILGSVEADPKKNIISNNSPLGKKLIGRSVGDEISLEIKGTDKKFKVVKII